MADRQNQATLLNCVVQSTWDDDLHVMPVSPMLEGAEREMTGIAGASYRLADPLSRIDKKQSYEKFSGIQSSLFWATSRALWFLN